MPAFNLKPTVSTYPLLAFTFGMVEQPAIPAAMLNWNIQLVFPPAMRDTDNFQFDFWPSIGMRRYAELGVLQLADCSTKAASDWSEAELTDRILAILGQERYALLGADFFHLPGTGQHGRVHFQHVLLIFEADPKAREFRGALFAKDWQFAAVTIPFGDLHRAYTARFTVDKTGQPEEGRRMFVAIRPGPAATVFAPLELADIRTQVEFYLAGKDLADTPLWNPVVAGYCQADTKRRPGALFGVAIYDFLAEYLERMLNLGKHWNAHKATRLLWEHKRLMGARLRRLAETGSTPGPIDLAAWEKIEPLAYMVHLKAVAVNRKKAPCARGYFSHELKEVKGREVEFLSHWLECFPV